MRYQMLSPTLHEAKRRLTQPEPRKSLQNSLSLSLPPPTETGYNQKTLTFAWPVTSTAPNERRFRNRYSIGSAEVFHHALPELAPPIKRLPTNAVLHGLRQGAYKDRAVQGATFDKKLASISSSKESLILTVRALKRVGFLRNGKT